MDTLSLYGLHVDPSGLNRLNLDLNVGPQVRRGRYGFKTHSLEPKIDSYKLNLDPIHKNKSSNA